MPVPVRVQQRLATALKRFQPVLEDARKRDVNESDTVTLVVDILHYVFGYDKYAEITSEHAIKGTYVDLAIRMNNQIQLLLEVKSIGTTLDERHTKQAVDYAANQGVDWVVLTNAHRWRIYKILFGKPITQELVSDLDLLQLNPKRPQDLEALWPLCRRGLLKSVLDEYHQQRQATSKYLLAAVVLSDPIVQAVRREVRRASGITISPEDLSEALRHDVLKREVTDGDAAKEAAKRVRKAQRKSLRAAATATRTIRPTPPAPAVEGDARSDGEADAEGILAEPATHPKGGE